MTSRDRVKAVLNFQAFDRLPIIEWAPYWNQTITRWQSEGLPSSLQNDEEIRDYFGLDQLLQIWVRSYSNCMRWDELETPLVRNDADYDQILKHLYPVPAVDPERLEQIAKAHEDGAAVWFTLEGFFWHPRWLLGIEEHLYAFYDQPKLMNRINEDNLEFLCRTIGEISSVFSPEFMTFAEDMSYNHGPMISKALFDEFQSPFYRRIVPSLKSKGIKVFVDSDGLVDYPVDWYREIGCEGILPLERQVGVDILKYREKHPDLLLIGAFDKTCMHKGEEAMRQEFERLLPVMKQGGYIPGVDHQTPPEVSMEDYRLFLALLREYCSKSSQPEIVDKMTDFLYIGV